MTTVNVALATPRLQLFEATEGTGARTYLLTADAPDPDILVFPAGTSKVFLESIAAAKALPERLRQRARAGEMRVVIDASSEGAEHAPSRAALLHEIAEGCGAPLSSTFYVTQEINYGREYAAWIAGQGAQGGLNVLHYDAWIWRFLRQFETAGAEVFAERLKAFRERPEVRSRRLVSLNFTPRPHKILFLLRLLHDGLWDKAFVSFGGVARFREIQGVSDNAGLSTSLASDGFEDLAHEVSGQLGALEAYGRVFLDPPSDGKFDPHADIVLPEYAQSWFAVVSETEMRPRPSRITEKTMKPLINFEPFLVLGNPHALKAIRALGFQTFEDIFDESYDDILDPRARFENAYQQARRLAAMPDSELLALERRVADKLVFNAELGLTKMPSVLRRSALQDLLAQILAPAHAL